MKNFSKNSSPSSTNSKADSDLILPCRRHPKMKTILVCREPDCSSLTICLECLCDANHVNQHSKKIEEYHKLLKDYLEEEEEQLISSSALKKAMIEKMVEKFHPLMQKIPEKLDRISQEIVQWVMKFPIGTMGKEESDRSFQAKFNDFLIDERLCELRKKLGIHLLSKLEEHLTVNLVFSLGEVINKAAGEMEKKVEEFMKMLTKESKTIDEKVVLTKIVGKNKKLKEVQTLEETSQPTVKMTRLKKRRISDLNVTDDDQERKNHIETARRTSQRCTMRNHSSSNDFSDNQDSRLKKVKPNSDTKAIVPDRTHRRSETSFLLENGSTDHSMTSADLGSQKILKSILKKSSKSRNPKKRFTETNSNVEISHSALKKKTTFADDKSPILTTLTPLSLRDRKSASIEKTQTLNSILKKTSHMNLRSTKPPKGFRNSSDSLPDPDEFYQSPIFSELTSPLLATSPAYTYNSDSDKAENNLIENQKPSSFENSLILQVPSIFRLSRPFSVSDGSLPEIHRPLSPSEAPAMSNTKSQNTLLTNGSLEKEIFDSHPTGTHETRSMNQRTSPLNVSLKKEVVNSESTDAPEPNSSNDQTSETSTNTEAFAENSRSQRIKQFGETEFFYVKVHKQVTIQSLTSGIACAKVIPTLNILFTAGPQDNIIKIWDLRKGSLLKELSGHRDYIKAIEVFDRSKSSRKINFTLAFEKDILRDMEFEKLLLVSGSVDKTVVIWNNFGGTNKILRGDEKCGGVQTIIPVEELNALLVGYAEKRISFWSMDRPGKSEANLELPKTISFMRYNSRLKGLAVCLKESYNDKKEPISVVHLLSIKSDPAIISDLGQPYQISGVVCMVELVRMNSSVYMFYALRDSNNVGFFDSQGNLIKRVVGGDLLYSMNIDDSEIVFRRGLGRNQVDAMVFRSLDLTEVQSFKQERALGPCEEEKVISTFCQTKDTVGFCLMRATKKGTIVEYARMEKIPEN